MPLSLNKRKIVCTIGPASASPEVMRQLLKAGMNIARLNFPQGGFSAHQRVFENAREAACAVGRPVPIMADLPGPKMRIGELAEETFERMPGDPFVLTTDDK